MFDLMPFDHRQRNMFSYLDKLEKDFFGDAIGSFSQFRTDIIEKDDRYILQAELPGFTKEDIHIELEGDYLTIRAEHNA
ncbi:MAG: Hsp20 family protein, partial [Oscillospiraceae bacterium]